MADISTITLPNGNTYNFKDVTSGYQTQSDVVSLMALIWAEVGNGPLIYQQPETDITAAAGSYAYYHVKALGYGSSNLTYQWQHSDNGGSSWANTSFVGNKTDTLRVSATAVRDGYMYRCNVTSGGVTVASSAGTLHVS